MFIGSGYSSALLNIHKYSLRTCKANETCKLICLWQRFFVAAPQNETSKWFGKKNPECSQFVRSSFQIAWYTVYFSSSDSSRVSSLENGIWVWYTFSTVWWSYWVPWAGNESYGLGIPWAGNGRGRKFEFVSQHLTESGWATSFWVLSLWSQHNIEDKLIYNTP